MSNPWYGITMTPHEIEEFLNEQATGVLSLSKERRAYGIPMSFAYDPERERAVMDFGFAEESKKREFLRSTDEACLTVYEWNGPHDWKSVVMNGSLEPIDEADVDEQLEGWYQRVAKDIDVPGANVELQWYELHADELTGVALFD